jgi:hypothetical protein
MNTLPAERDMPPAAQAAGRARAVATVTHPPTRSRLWVPLAAAAALIAVVAGSAVAVAVRRSEPVPPPAATATPTAPTSRAGLLATCAGYVDLADLAVRWFGDRSPVVMRALFRDRYGYLVYIGTDRTDANCSLAPDGSRMRGAGAGGSDSGYVNRPGEAVVVAGYGTCSVPADRLGYYVTGRVSRKVARVVVTWPGAAPVTAALDGPYFAARATFPGTKDAERPGELVAYDAAGNVVDRDNGFF